jgi:hypothetical protein
LTCCLSNSDHEIEVCSGNLRSVRKVQNRTAFDLKYKRAAVRIISLFVDVQQAVALRVASDPLAECRDAADARQRVC